MISEMVNQLSTQNDLHIIKVHTTATLFHQRSNGDLRNVGYNRTAFDFAEAIYDAASLGWIPDRVYHIANATNTTGLPVTGTSAGSSSITSSSASTSRQEAESSAILVTLTPLDSSASILSTTTSTTPSPPTPTSKLAIALAQLYDREIDIASNPWNFHAQPLTASSYDACAPLTTATIDPSIDATLGVPSPTDLRSVPFPSGTFDVGTLGDAEQMSECNYVGIDTAVGTLTCGNGVIEGFTCEKAADLPTDQSPVDTLIDNECGTVDLEETFAFKVTYTW